MDEQQITSPSPAAPEAPREIVLRYVPPGPGPVVERYIHRDPLPSRRGTLRGAPGVPPPPSEEAEAAEEELSPEPRRKGVAWRRATALILAVALLAGVCAGLYHRGGQARQPEESENRGSVQPSYGFEWRSAGAPAGETEISRAPLAPDVRLAYTEAHGPALRIQEVYTRVNPCTVTVATALPGSGAVIGTGVIFTPDGYILTNAHVVTGGRECYVVRDTGRSYGAELVGMDEEKDLAVLKIDGSMLPTAEFGDSDALTVGDTVYAIGNPLGAELRGTLTDGIVSAINRDVMVDGVSMTLIQTNAALNNGNSGGPLINVYGQVVGINTMKMGSSSAASVEGLGFAIPVSSAVWMVNDLLTYGELQGEPVLGLSVLREPVTLDSGETALEIQELIPGGPGEAAGLQLGDRIVRADGEVLRSVSDLLRARRRYGTGEALPLEIDRGGERFDAEVILSVLED